MTVEAFNMAETYRTPVMLLFDEVWPHARVAAIPNPGEIPLVERLRTSVKGGSTIIPICRGKTGGCP
jgi:2-oxoglutarate ferredoxin oxidoreductase subunit alpha